MSWPTGGALPGNGPWMILQDCPVEQHNTQRSKGCICPRAEELRRRRRMSKAQRAEFAEQMRALGRQISPSVAARSGAAASASNWRRARPLYLIGNGPWMVQEDCPAVMHNSSAAAKTRGATRCLCPHTEAIRRRYKEVESVRKKKERGTYGKPEKSTEIIVPQAIYMTNTRGVKPRAWAETPCRTDVGLKIVDAAFENEAWAVLAMKDTLCGRCPLRKACGDYALENEVDRFNRPSPGVWGGIYGGMTPNDRRKVMGQ